MKYSLLYKAPDDLLKRFPIDSYTIFGMPYVFVKKPNILKVINCNNVLEFDDKKADGHFYAIFKKLNWANKNDLILSSQGFDRETYRMKTDSEMYYQNCVREMLVMIKDENTGNETWLDAEVLRKINKNNLSDIMSYFFMEEHFETMSDEQENDLRRHLHNYFSYWRKKEFGDNSAGSDPPVCPSIVWKVTISERFGWTFKEVENLSEYNVKALQVLSSQEKVNSFESENDGKFRTTADFIEYNKEHKNPASKPPEHIPSSSQQEVAEEQQEVQSPASGGGMAFQHLRKLRSGNF